MTESLFHKEYLPLAETLYRIAHYILESEAEAEGAVQELYLRLWESRDGLDGIRLPKAYAIRMLRNICVDKMRKARHETFPEELPQTQFAPAPDDTLDARARLDKVLEAGNRDWNTLKARVRDALSSYIYQVTMRSPIILPIFLEV